MFIKPYESIEVILNKLNNSDENELYIVWDMYTYEAIEKLKNIFFNVAKLNKNMTIIISLSKVCDFELLDISKYENMGLNFRISFQNFTYTYDEFNLLNNKLNNYLKDIINDNMSPYEKYISIYNFVRKFKEYKVIDQTDVEELRQLISNKNQSCNLRYILENDYIDCLGFCLLLETFLNKVNIESVKFGFDVNNIDGTFLGSHARTLINIDDDKYDIHGIFVSDPTWDRQSDDNKLQFSLLPISSMRENIYSKCDTTLLFDFSNDEEFNANLRSLFSRTKYEDFKQKIIGMIYSIDRNKSSTLININDDRLFYFELKNYISSKNQSLKSVSGIRK